MRWIRPLVLMSLCLCVWTAHAAQHLTTTTLKLHSIQTIKTTEADGDELFLSITDQALEGEDEANYHIPAYPLFWSSQAVDKLKDIVLWEDTLKEGEERILMLGLGEQDLVEQEFISSIQLKLVKKNGIVQQYWGRLNSPQYQSKAVTKAQVQSYVFKGHGGEYKLSFIVDEE